MIPRASSLSLRWNAEITTSQVNFIPFPLPTTPLQRSSFVVTAADHRPSHVLLQKSHRCGSLERVRSMFSPCDALLPRNVSREATYKLYHWVERDRLDPLLYHVASSLLNSSTSTCNRIRREMLLIDQQVAKLSTSLTNLAEVTGSMGEEGRVVSMKL